MGDGIMLMGEAEGMLGDGDGEIALENESTIQLDEMLAAAAAAGDADAGDNDRAYDDKDGDMVLRGGVRINIEDGDGAAGHRARFEQHHRRPFHHHTTQQQQQQQQQRQQEYFADIDGDDERGDDDDERHASLRVQIEESGRGNSTSHVDAGGHVALDIRKF
jgi:hypothetical protein